MKKRGFFSTLIYGVFIIACCLGFLTWLFWSERSDWPVFPSDKPAQVQVQQPQDPNQDPSQNPAQNPVPAPNPGPVAKPATLDPEIIPRVARDFGWRIGDVVPVDFYIKQMPGTELDLHSVAMEGDFELAGQPEIVEHLRADGSKVYRLKARFQSFNKAKEWTLKANFAYRVLATNDDVTVSLPVLKIYTSNTWDGRDIIQTGKLEPQFGWQNWITLAFIGVGYLFMRFFWKQRQAILSFLPEVAEHFGRSTRFIAARKRFDRIWARMEERGDRSRENYLALSRVFRKLYKVETKTGLEIYYWYLYGRNGPIEISEMIDKCERVIYLDETLSDEEHYSIKKTFDRLCPPSVVKNTPPRSGTNRR